MRDRRSKVKGSPQSGLPSLAPEAQAALQEQVARVAAALAADRDPAAVQELLSPRPQDLAWDLHLLAALGALAHPGVPALLAGVFGSVRDKARRKALKRALHNLKTRGVPVPAALLPREEVSVGTPRGATEAYVSPVFGNGDSYVILEGPAEILGGNFLVALVNDREGFREFHLLNLNPKQQKEFWGHFRQPGREQQLPVPSPYAVRLLEEAYQVNPQAESGAGRYAGLREQIFKLWGRPEDAPGPEQLLPEISPGDAVRLLEQSLLLAPDPLFHSWLPSSEEITPWFRKIQEVEASPLVLSEPQRRVRLEAVMDEATRALFPPESRPLWSRRLRTMAYYLDLWGRGEHARALQAAADDLAGDRNLLLGENPFLKGLVQFALRLAWETQENPRRRSLLPGWWFPPLNPC